MPISALDPVNIVAADLEGTAAFHADAVGLSSGWRPDFASPGAWSYTGDQTVTHVAEPGGSGRPGWLDTGSVAGIPQAFRHEASLDRM